MTDKNTRYDNPPISDKTREGMTLNSDDLQAIGRLLMLQDDAYEEQFEKLTIAVEQIARDIIVIRGVLKDHDSRIRKLEKFHKQSA